MQVTQKMQSNALQVLKVQQKNKGIDIIAGN